MFVGVTAPPAGTLANSLRWGLFCRQKHCLVHLLLCGMTRPEGLRKCVPDPSSRRYKPVLSCLADVIPGMRPYMVCPPWQSWRSALCSTRIWV